MKKMDLPSSTFSLFFNWFNCSCIAFTAFSPDIVGIVCNRKFPSLKRIEVSTVFKAFFTRSNPSFLLIVTVLHS